MTKNNIPEIEKALKNNKLVALLAPSFITDFTYPSIISQLKQLGFKKVVELTFGAKMVNKEYHKLLCNSTELVITSVCPGVSSLIETQFPKYTKNLAKIDSPMIATGKVCRKIYPGYKTCFISPCHMKKAEAESSNYIDYVIDYQQLHQLFVKHSIVPSNKEEKFNKFYNDYTKVYPLSGGLSKTAHIRGVVKPGEIKIIDGWKKIEKFMGKPNKEIRFLDVTFCTGGCIGGPCTSKLSIRKKRKLLLKYLNRARHESISEENFGSIEKAKGINFKK